MENFHHHPDERLGRTSAFGRRPGAARVQFRELLAVQRQHQLGGGGKVAVQGAQRNVRLGSDFGKDHGVQALAGEPGGNVEDPGVAEPLPGQGGRRSHRWKF